jgi:toxin ParE1/3/4
VAIEFSQAAEDDLRGVFLYGIQEHGVAQAELYKGQLEKTFQTLSGNPKIARLRREITPPVRVYPAHQHMIVYTILEDGQTVYVLRVRHHSENWMEHPLDTGGY